MDLTCLSENIELMYDTIDFTLWQSDVPNIDFLEEVSLLLPEERKTVGTRDKKGEFVSGYYRTYFVEITRCYLRVCRSSLCKFKYGDNFHTLSLPDVKSCIEEIGQYFNLPFHLARVTRIDIAFNLRLTYPVRDYLSCFVSFAKKERLSFDHGVYFKSLNETLSFYDKNKETKTENESENLLRYECRILKPKKVVGEVFAYMLYEPVFWNKLLDRWLDRYLNVEKRFPFKYDLTSIKKKTDLCELGLQVLYDQKKSIFEDIKTLRDQRKLTKNQAQNLSRTIHLAIAKGKEGRKCDLIEELDNAIWLVYDQYKIEL